MLWVLSVSVALPALRLDISGAVGWAQIGPRPVCRQQISLLYYGGSTGLRLDFSAGGPALGTKFPLVICIHQDLVWGERLVKFNFDRSLIQYPSNLVRKQIHFIDICLITVFSQRFELKIKAGNGRRRRKSRHDYIP